jgi:endonuclease YncB( thermonuclease family)
MSMPISLIAALLASAMVSTSASQSQSASHRMAVLDGDTVVVDGSAFHVAGIDAPELGPWAKCWAEAALAGHARENLQRLLGDTERRGWQLRDVSAPDANGKRTARLVDQEGYDVTDDMVVYGYAASTSGSWDWCGGNAGLRQVLDGDQPPHGPNLWWPTAHMFDPRAAD